VSGSRSDAVHYSPRRHAVRAQRQGRARYLLSLLAVTVSFGLVALTLAQPRMPAVAVTGDPPRPHHGQTVALSAVTVDTVTRDGFSVTKRQPPRVAAVPWQGVPRAAAPDPGTAQAIAYRMLQARGMGADQYSCLVALWNHESHWNVYAGNPVSGAYGIPQALPGSKMASAGPNWQSDATTQITWGLGYISGRYGTPCAALAHWQASNWY
jgi:hypothetical protein